MSRRLVCLRLEWEGGSAYRLSCKSVMQRLVMHIIMLILTTIQANYHARKIIQNVHANQVIGVALYILVLVVISSGSGCFNNKYFI